MLITSLRNDEIFKMAWTAGSRYFALEVLRYQTTSQKNKAMWFHEFITLPGFSNANKIVKANHVELLENAENWWISQTVSFVTSHFSIWDMHLNIFFFET